MIDAAFLLRKGFRLNEFYVYELRDPRCGLPFYIGKGKGKRIDAHERQARMGVSSPKCERIKDIWAAGLEVEKEKIQFFICEKEAFQFEIERIHEIGRDNLTNFGRVAITVEQRNFYLARVVALMAKIQNGRLVRPNSTQRPFASALWMAVQRADLKDILRMAVRRAGFDDLRLALIPHGVDLQHGG